MLKCLIRLQIINQDYLNVDLINKEAKYDGLYAVCTNLDDNANEIIKINHNRWEIEESFMILSLIWI